MSNLPVPSESDWENYQDDIDATHAHDLFIGKTNEQMREQFQRCVIERTDELRFMPKIPFRYYMLGFGLYIRSIKIPDSSNMDTADAASCFINLVEEILNARPDDINPIMSDLLPTVEYIAANQESFDCDIEIYGNFPEKYQSIKNLSKRDA